MYEFVSPVAAGLQTGRGRYESATRPIWPDDVDRSSLITSGGLKTGRRSLRIGDPAQSAVLTTSIGRR
jgi:hypothetical protein